MNEITFLDWLKLLTAALFFVCLAYWLGRSGYKPTRSRRRRERDARLTYNEILSSLKKYGFNTNSIFHLYDSFNHSRVNGKAKGKFQEEIFGFETFPRFNIVFSDPLCDPKNRTEVLRRLTKFGKDDNKDTILFAIGQSFADAAKDLSFKVVAIGKEPQFDLKKWNSELLSSKLKSALRQVEKRGIVFEELSLQQLHEKNMIDEMNEILQSWFLSRASERFKSLTEVNPAAGSTDKKFFVARQAGRLDAFLIASPIYAKNGYFLQDLIRTGSSVSGVADALIVHALESLKNQGYEMASLGISPLAGLDDPVINKDHPKLNSLLKFVFKNQKFPVHFKDLYSFKKKFEPTHEEFAYVALSSRWFKLDQVWILSQLISEFNLLGFIKFKLNQWHHGIDLPKPLKWILNSEFIVLPKITNLRIETLLARFKFTLLVLFLNIYTFLFTGNFDTGINTMKLKEFGFSYENFFHNKWFVLFTSNFLHFNVSHLTLNMIGILLFTASLEGIAGSVTAALTFLIGMQANIPNGLVLLPFLREFYPSLSSSTFSYVDVGASLGLFGSLGGLMYFMHKKAKWFTGIIAVASTAVFSIFNEELIGFDHGFALFLGYSISYLYNLRNVSQDRFEQGPENLLDIPNYFANKHDGQSLVHSSSPQDENKKIS